MSFLEYSNKVLFEGGAKNSFPTDLSKDILKSEIYFKAFLFSILKNKSSLIIL